MFYWLELERQVIVEGKVKKIKFRESEEYFKARPRSIQLASWVSKQSGIISDRRELEKLFRKVERKFKGRNVPKPPFWGGYRLIPHVVEFWPGGKNRLNDWLRYRLKRNKRWQIERLAL